MEDLLPIGAFSESSGLSVKRLRTYAAAGVLVPAAIDPSTGYRYYSPSQLNESRVIDLLRQAGVRLADIRTFLAQPSLRQLEDWTDRLGVEAKVRENALHAAWRLMANESRSISPVHIHDAEEASMTTLVTAASTEKGPVREDNQDAIVASDCLAVVADGMGGPPGGALAATTLTGAVEAAFTGRSADELQAAVRAANWAIWDRAAKHEELEGMGSTICAAGLLEDGRVVVLNVGDSRGYLWRDAHLTQLTQDHTVTAELVRNGELSTIEAPEHPHYGILTRAVGVAPSVQIDCSTLAVESGDRLVVCSDGLFNEVAATDISTVMSKDEDLLALAEELVALAIARGGRDNVSVVVAELLA